MICKAGLASAWGGAGVDRTGGGASTRLNHSAKRTKIGQTTAYEVSRLEPEALVTEQRAEQMVCQAEHVSADCQPVEWDLHQRMGERI